jgi:hypothetical protein
MSCALLPADNVPARPDWLTGSGAQPLTADEGCRADQEAAAELCV